MADCDSLFVICLRHIVLENGPILRLPEKIRHLFRSLKAELRLFTSTTGDLFNENNSQILRHCLVIDPSTYLMDTSKTIMAMEPYLSAVDFFDVCTRYALDEPTSRIYCYLSAKERDELSSRNGATRCRLLELLNDHREMGSIDLYYDEVALDCAAYGFLEALERSLLKIGGDLNDDLLPKCSLKAIANGHYHIANRIICDNYERAFYYVFPDGRVSPKYFAALLRDDLVKDGDRIAAALLRYLPKLDVQRLRRAMEADNMIAKSGLLKRFDTMYSEIIDQHNYPCDIE